MSFALNVCNFGHTKVRSRGNPVQWQRQKQTDTNALNLFHFVRGLLQIQLSSLKTKPRRVNAILKAMQCWAVLSICWKKTHLHSHKSKQKCCATFAWPPYRDYDLHMRAVSNTILQRVHYHFKILANKWDWLFMVKWFVWSLWTTPRSWEEFRDRLEISFDSCDWWSACCGVAYHSIFRPSLGKSRSARKKSVTEWWGQL